MSWIGNQITKIHSIDDAKWSEDSSHPSEDSDSDSSEEIPEITEYYKKLKIRKDESKEEKKEPSLNNGSIVKHKPIINIWKNKFNDLKKKKDIKAMAMHPGLFEGRNLADLDEDEAQAWALSLQYNDVQKEIYGKGIDGNYLIKNIKKKSDIGKLLGINDPIDIKRLWTVIKTSKSEKTKKKFELKALKANNNEYGFLNKDFNGMPMNKWIVNDCKSWMYHEMNKMLKLEKSSLNKIFKCFDENNIDGSYLVFSENKSTFIELFKNIKFKLNKNENKKILYKIAIDIQSEIVKRLEYERDQIITFGLDNEEVKSMEFDTDKERIIDLKKYKQIKLSKKPDLIFQYTDEDDVRRAEMSCGCAMSAQAMFYYLSELANSGYELTPMCPNLECKKQKKAWNWGMCIMVADLTSKERDYLNDLKFRRASGNKQLCPHCTSMITRPKDLQNFRVNCQSCSNSDWCWSCKRPWKTGSTLICGNPGCNQTSQIKHINKALQNCPKINETIGYISDKMKNNKNDIPKQRACVKCISIIEWQSQCKHMTCPSCSENFCFVCLKPKKDGNWQCGSHTTACDVAPRQVFK